MKREKYGIVIGEGELGRMDAGFYIPDSILKVRDGRIRSVIESALKHDKKQEEEKAEHDIGKKFSGMNWFLLIATTIVITTIIVWSLLSAIFG